MSANLAALHPELQPFARELVRAAGAAGLMPQVTSTVRSHSEQARLYRRFLSGQQPYPVARPGTSAHEFGWAFDMVVSPMDDLVDVGDYWEQLGGVWGGRPTIKGHGYDPVHFEYPGWRDLVTPDEIAEATQPTLSRSITRLPSAAEDVLSIASPLPYGGQILENQIFAVPRAVRLLVDPNYTYLDYLKEQLGISQ